MTTFSELYNALLKQTKSGASQAARLILEGFSSILTRLLPPGGTVNQVLAKLSGADYDVGWSSTAAGGGGYRQFTYNLDGAGDFQFIKLSTTGQPVMVLLPLE